MPVDPCRVLGREVDAAGPAGERILGEAWRLLVGMCPVVTIEDVASGDAEHQLESDWPGTGRPDVWSPAATTWVRLLEYKRPGLLPSGQPQSIATSPLVVAMPDRMARALGWPTTQPSWKKLLVLADDPRGWGEFGHPEWGPFRLGKTDPRISTSGINSLIAAYDAATGKSSNLSITDVNDTNTRAFVAGVEKSVSHYAPTVASFLQNLAAADSYTYISAIAVEEQEMFNYNLGAYGSSSPNEPPTVQLDAIYPAEGTLVADHPFVVLRAPWVNEAKQRIANDFLAWLLQPGQQRRFTEVGFRNYNMEAGDTLSADKGILTLVPSQRLVLPDAAVVAAIQNSWNDLRKPARVLMILDLATTSERTLVHASVADVAQLSNRDRVAVLDLQPASRVSEPESLQDGGRARALATIDSVPVGAGSGTLYAAVESAYQFLTANFEPEFINAVVVIASHRDSGRGPTLTALELEIRIQANSTPVRIYTVALPGSDSEALLGIERASGGVPSSSASSPAAAIRTCLGNF